MQEQALKTMGENKASYLMKDAVDRVPASDQEDVKQVKQGLGNALGGSMQNPLGKAVGPPATPVRRPRQERKGAVDLDLHANLLRQGGDFADDATKEFTGR